MGSPIYIVMTDRIDQQTVLVEFSDHTYAMFTVEQLLSLAPERVSSDEEV